MVAVILGLVGLVLSNVATVAIANALLGAVRTGHDSADAVLLLVLRVLLVSATVQVAGLLGILDAAGVTAICAVILAALWLAGLRDWRPAIRRPDLGWLLGIAMAAAVARLLWQVWFFVPYTADALSYHLPKIAEWIRAGAFTREMGVDSQATFPAGFELLETWWVVFLHHDVVIELAGVEMLALAAIATYALARHVGLPSRWACLAAFLFAMTPGVHLGATSCLNDTAVAALVLSTAALVVARAPMGILLLLVGLGLGVKPTYGYALPGLLVLWTLEWRSDRTGRRVWGSRMAIALGCVGMLVGGFWYLRNWLWFGNPVYPMGTTGIHRAGGGPIIIQFGPSLRGLLENVSDMFEHRVLDELAYSGLSRGVSGWGAWAFACGFIALPLALREADDRFRRLAIAFGCSLLSVVLFALHDLWYMRFVFFFPALLAIAVAWLVQSNRWVMLPLIPALIVAFLGTFKPEELSADALRSLAALPWRERTLAAYHHVDWQGDAMGYYAEDVGESYWLYRPDYSCRVFYLRALTAEGLMQEIREAGLKEFYALPGSQRRLEVIREATQRGLVRQRPPQTFYEVN